MTTKTPDRRVQRTRQLLQHALFALILEQGYESITIQHIIDRANVGRATFYAHYQDKQHLFVSGFAELRVLLERELVSAHPPGELKLRFSLPMFEHVLAYRSVWRALIGKHSGAIVQKQLQQVLTDVIRDEVMMLAAHGGWSIPIELVVEYTVGAFMGLLMWWADHDTALTASQMDAIFQQLALSGLFGTGSGVPEVRR